MQQSVQMFQISEINMQQTFHVLQYSTSHYLFDNTGEELFLQTVKCDSKVDDGDIDTDSW